jgi:hypothetical protein
MEQELDEIADMLRQLREDAGESIGRHGEYLSDDVKKILAKVQALTPTKGE